jgi:hypothetical protein
MLLCNEADEIDDIEGAFLIDRKKVEPMVLVNR